MTRPGDFKLHARAIGAACMLLCLLIPASCRHAGHSQSGDSAHHRFEDADAWAQRFERPERDTWQKPDQVLSLMGLPEDAVVADIGAATGYFPVRFARACPKGKVFGVDIEADMVRFLNERAAKEGLTNLTSIQCTADDPNIPEPVDVIFICNTYHHIENRVAYFERCKRVLKPGGRVVIVDFFKKELPIGPAPAHKLVSGAVIRELTRAGYRLTLRDVSLPYQYVLIFELAG